MGVAIDERARGRARLRGASMKGDAVGIAIPRPVGHAVKPPTSMKRGAVGRRDGSEGQRIRAARRLAVPVSRKIHSPNEGRCSYTAMPWTESLPRSKPDLGPTGVLACRAGWPESNSIFLNMSLSPLKTTVVSPMNPKLARQSSPRRDPRGRPCGRSPLARAPKSAAPTRRWERGGAGQRRPERSWQPLCLHALGPRHSHCCRHVRLADRDAAWRTALSVPRTAVGAESKLDKTGFHWKAMDTYCSFGHVTSSRYLHVTVGKEIAGCPT